MATFKYTVATAEGKSLSGTVEAPDETTARSELNNLGFAVLTLQETAEKPEEQSHLPKFVFEATDKFKRPINGTIPANDEIEAFTKLEKEYGVIVTAIWPKDATAEQITEARTKGAARLAEQLSPEAKQEIENKTAENAEEIARNSFTKNKVEHILQKIQTLREKFASDFQPNENAQINKHLEKILRIKNSTNSEYLILSTDTLLNYLLELEPSLSQMGKSEQAFELRLATKEMQRELHSTASQKTLSEDIVEKIRSWQNNYKDPQTEQTEPKQSFIYTTLEKLRKYFETPMEIKAIREQIKVYNQQLFEFIKLYFKEPTAEYKAKVKQNLKDIWQARAHAKENLTTLKLQLKAKKHPPEPTSFRLPTLLEDLTSLSGWILAFYTIYYIIGLYLNTKDFGLTTIPNAFNIYDSHLFKYLLVIIFLLHTCLTLKTNFFPKNHLATILLPIIFTLTSLIVIFNF